MDENGCRRRADSEMLESMRSEISGREDAADVREIRRALTREAGEFVRSDGFFEVLTSRVARRTESQESGNGQAARDYLNEDIVPELAALGFDSTIHDNPESDEHPLLIATRVEDPDLPTVLLYGHGDVQ